MRIAASALIAATLVMSASVGAVRAQDSRGLAGPVVQFDRLLDALVRDGLVYYAGLKGQREGLDRYVASLAMANPAEGTETQLAFWINAYNALVLQTVIDHYPIHGQSDDYPPSSIRQIPGAFDRTPHRVAGRLLTLDQIEETILPGFGDPRVFLTLGRGAIGGSRLRSAAYTAEALDHQLDLAAAECADHAQCLKVDREANALRVSSLFAWRRAEFVAAYAGEAPPTFDKRSPIERAILAFTMPALYGAEREFLERNRFVLEYIPFDWRLNDLNSMP